MIDYEIASYQRPDQDDLVQFFRAVFEVMGFELDLNSKDRDLLDIPGQYQSGGGAFFLARCRGELIGTVALRPIAEQACELARFYVRPAYQRGGVGTGLLRRAIDHARAARWTAIRLDTTRRSPAAISLLRKQGFVEIERYLDDPTAEIFMELSLQR